MGATAMTVVSSRAATYDESAVVSDKACLPLADGAEATAYAGSGLGAVRGQLLTEVGALYTHLVDQSVVLFSSAHDADAFFTASARSWPACSNRQFTYNEPGKRAVWTVGPVSNVNGTLSATKTRENANGWTCQRALTVANNVAIDVTTCSPTHSAWPRGQHRPSDRRQSTHLNGTSVERPTDFCRSRGGAAPAKEVP